MVCTSAELYHRALFSPPQSREQLAHWIFLHLGMEMPESSVCPHHQTPLDYLAHAFFEGRAGSDVEGAAPCADAVVWACRGGGKTMVGAIATLLDLLFKPEIQIRILGGSFEQSEKMYDYLRQLIERHFAPMLLQPPTQRRLVLINGSRVDVLSQSNRSVRGQRVQKLRCDEVELFDPSVWQAAQLTTRSITDPEEIPGGRPITGAVEAFSTMHKPGGLMQQILSDSSQAAARKTFAWCVWDVIEKCPAQRSCGSCPLFDACQGRAKFAAGFVKIDDVIAIRSRISRATWNHEMLCQPPIFEDAVFPAFRPEKHLRSFEPGAIPGGLRRGVMLQVETVALTLDAIVCGVDFGYAQAFVCLWIALFKTPDGSSAAWVFDELVTREQTVARNAAAMRQRSGDNRDPSIVYCDVAGHQTNSQTARGDEEVLRAAGFKTKSRAMEIVEGIDLVSDLLDPAAGRPRLYIDPRCVRLIEAFQGYRKNQHGRPEKDGRHDHLIDALRYALVNHQRPSARIEVRLY